MSKVIVAFAIFLLIASFFVFSVNARTPVMYYSTRAPATFVIPALPTTADILLTLTPSKTKVASGASVSYLYNVSNTGETALTGAIVDDVFGPVGNLVNLQPGGWVGYNVTHVISANTSNVATAWGINQFGTNVTSAASAFVQVYSGADILLTLTPSKTKVASGASVSYLYNVSNTGETALTGAM